MLTVFSRKELTITYSMKEQARIRDALSSCNIEYSLRTINRNSPSPFGSTRGRTGTFGQNMELAYEYIFYVRRSEYDKAVAALNGTFTG